MRWLLLLISCFAIGCASIQQTKVYQGTPLAHNEVSRVTSMCDNQCQQLIEKQLGIKKALYGTSIKPVIIQVINGQKGQLSHGDYDGVFNHASWLQYDLEMQSGEQKLQVFVNYHLAKNPEMIAITFNTQGGDEYFLGQILDMPPMAEGSRYKWMPVLVNITDSKVIALQKPSGWIHYPG